RSHKDAIFCHAPEDEYDLAAESKSEYRSHLMLGGRNPDVVQDVTAGRDHKIITDLGAGVGGSSALFGMILERFFPSDFTPRANHTGDGRSTLPESWPLTYDDLKPWYALAERLYRVRGSADPLRPVDAADALLPATKMIEANQELFDFLQGRGLNPYAAHVACEDVPGCMGCKASLCPNDCRNDAGRICVLPAITEHGAELLSECTAERLETGHTAVEKLICNWRGQTIRLESKLFVIAGGALFTPALLLNSACEKWPRGVANSSDMVGRNLMRHIADLHLVAPNTRFPFNERLKEIAFNDFYSRDGRKYGTVQSFGPLPPVQRVLQRAEPGPYQKLLRLGTPIGEFFWNRLRSRRLALATIMEDLPYAENRVLPTSGPDGNVRFQYTLHEYEARRSKEFEAELVNVLQPYPVFTMRGARSNRTLGHVSGTCRFGTDPKTSVLDATNRAHDLSNLYITDASFFPSSGGTNPSLTIAANALRVASLLLDRL
ncbi:MAG TPA: GMC family oxidoreductase, partial [Bryobacteraceae bacterium]|nr:GMC family oxidoreductase [Bryobacteraceae bacterium]